MWTTLSRLLVQPNFIIRCRLMFLWYGIIAVQPVAIVYPCMSSLLANNMEHSTPNVLTVAVPVKVLLHSVAPLGSLLC
jgi:hypothetical protein